MCHGHLDPKYALREAQDRLKSVSWRVDTSEAALPAFGLLARLRAAMARLNRKEATECPTPR